MFAEYEVAALFPAEVVAAPEHFIDDVFVTHTSADDFATSLFDGGVESRVAHDGGDEGFFRKGAFGKHIQGGDSHDVIAIYQISAFVTKQDAIRVTIVSDPHVRAKFTDARVDVLGMHGAALFVNVRAIGLIGDDDDFRTQFPEHTGSGFIRRAVGAINHNAHSFKCEASRERGFGLLDVSSQGVVYADGFANGTGGGANVLDLAAEDEAFDLRFNRVIQFVTVGAEEFNSVIVVRIMRGGDDNAGIGSETSGDVSHTGRGEGTNKENISAHGEDTGGNGVLQHVTGKTGVFANDYLMTTVATRTGFHVLENMGGGATQFERGFRGDRFNVGNAADTIGTENLLLFAHNRLKLLGGSVVFFRHACPAQKIRLAISSDTCEKAGAMLKQTPLFAAHQKRGGKLIEFGGWEMPVQYSSIVDEHLCVRKAGGIFDICHMGEVRLTGSSAGAFLNSILTNDINKLSIGMGQYSLMCNEKGGAVDDLYVYRVAETEYLAIINASRIAEDVTWMKNALKVYVNRGAVSLENLSESCGAVAIQGPRVVEIIDQCFPGSSRGGMAVTKASELKKNQVARFGFQGTSVWVARTGYTGEDGFEVVASALIIEAIWEKVLDLGHAICLQPAGLGARDTLRTEMCYPLYGHELDEETTPIEAGIGFFVALDKGEFTGRAVLAEQKSSGVKKKAVAFRMAEKSAPPRPGYPLWSPGAEAACIGKVASGTQSPSLNVGIGIGYVPTEFAVVGSRIEVEIRGKRFAAEIVTKPIYRKPA